MQTELFAIPAITAHCNDCDHRNAKRIVARLARDLSPEALQRGVDQLMADAAGQVDPGERRHDIMRAAMCKEAVQVQQVHRALVKKMERKGIQICETPWCKDCQERMARKAR